MATSAELVERVKSSFETKNPGLLMQVLTQASGAASQLVLEELEIQIENLKNEAIKQFDQELYRDSLESFQFLCELQPQDHTLRDYLELCGQMIGQSETSRSEEKLADAFKVFDEVNQDLKNTPESSQTTPVFSQDLAHVDTTPLASPVETTPEETLRSAWQDTSSGSETYQSKTSVTTSLLLVRSHEDTDRKPSPTWRTRFLRRCLRVSALVILILSIGIILSLWTRRVRAPQSTDGRGDETVSEQIQDSKQPVKERTYGQRRATEDKRNEAFEADDKKFSASGDSIEDQLQQTSAYPVIHNHRFGNCRGEIRISRESVAFVPFENSGDGFKHQPADILEIELDNTLKIQFIDRTYRFKPGSAGGKRTNRARLKQLYQQLIELKRETQ